MSSAFWRATRTSPASLPNCLPAALMLLVTSEKSVWRRGTLTPRIFLGRLPTVRPSRTPPATPAIAPSAPVATPTPIVLPLGALSRTPLAADEAVWEARSRPLAPADPFLDLVDPFLDLVRELSGALPRVRLAVAAAARFVPDALALDALPLDELGDRLPLDELGDLDRDLDPRAAAAADDAWELLPSPPLLPAREAPLAESEAGALPLDCGVVLRDVVPLRCVAGAIS
jgi:hypothetical protein